MAYHGNGRVLEEKLWSYVLHPRLLEAPHADLFRARLLVGLNLVSILFAPLIFLYMLPNFGLKVDAHAWAFGVLFLGAILSLALLRSLGSFRMAASVLLVCPLMALMAFAWMEQVAVSGTYFWFAGLGLFGLYLFGLRLGKYWCALVLVCQLTLIEYFRAHGGLIPVGMSSSEFVCIFAGDVLGVTLGIWTIAALYEMQRQRFEKDLEAAQHEVIQHREKLMQGARLSELGQMAGGVAHEINNPLAVVHGYSLRLKRDLERNQTLSAEQTAMFHSIERSCRRIATISRALLSYAHEGSYEQDVVFTLHKLQEELMELCRERMRSRDISLKVDCPDPNRSISGKYVKLLQVIVNLVNNAIDAVATCPEKWIRLDLLLHPLGLQVGVNDSGAGVPEHLRERITSPFFTTKPVGKGTGLGLSIVDGIVRDLQGQFYLDTGAPHTRFVVQFPLAWVASEPV